MAALGWLLNLGFAGGTAAPGDEWAIVGDDTEIVLGTGATGSTTVTVPTGARKAIVTVHMEHGGPSGHPTINAISVAGKALAVADDGTTTASRVQSNEKQELWHVDLEAADEGAGKTYDITLSAGAGVQTRAALQFFNQQGTVVTVALDGASSTSTGYSALPYNTPGLMIMAIAARNNLTGWAPGTGQTTYFDQIGVGDAAAASTYETYTSGTSDTPSASWTAQRSNAGVAVTFVSTPSEPLAAPTGGKIDIISQHQLDTTIDIQAVNALHEWERQKHGDMWDLVGTTNSGVATFRHEGLERLTAYNFRARALQDNEASTYLEVGTAKTWAAPSATILRG